MQGWGEEIELTNWNESEHRIKHMYDPSMYILENISGKTFVKEAVFLKEFKSHEFKFYQCYSKIHFFYLQNGY